MHTPSALTTEKQIQIFVDATDHESGVGSLLLLKRRTENGQGYSCSRCPLSIIIYWKWRCYRKKDIFFTLTPFYNKAVVWVYPGDHLLGETWAYLNYSLAEFNMLVCFLIKQEAPPVHLNASSCPSCILLMALSPINKACGWLLDAACLPGMLSPHLALQYAWGFWHAYRASPQWITNREGIRKTYSSYISTSSDMGNQRDLGGRLTVS